MSSNITIPWISYTKELSPYKRKLTKAFLYVKEFEEASDALSDLEINAYPVILIQDWPNKTSKLLPKSKDNYNPIDITCYIISEIRRIKKHQATPIIVPHLALKKEKEEYLKAGATTLVDILTPSNSLEALLNTIKITINTTKRNL